MSTTVIAKSVVVHSRSRTTSSERSSSSSSRLVIVVVVKVIALLASVAVAAVQLHLLLTTRTDFSVLFQMPICTDYHCISQWKLMALCRQYRKGHRNWIIYVYKWYDSRGYRDRLSGKRLWCIKDVPIPCICVYRIKKWRTMNKWIWWKWWGGMAVVWCYMC